MIRSSYAYMAAVAIGLAPLVAWPSGESGGEAKVQEGIVGQGAPTPAELARATYTGIEDQGPVTLTDDRWEGPPPMEGAASVPAVWLSEGFRLVGDLDGDGSVEAVAHLTYSSGGTGNFGYLAVMGRKEGRLVQLAIGPVGDRVQIRGAKIAGNTILLDVLQAGPDDGMCCPTQLATDTFAIENGKLVETSTEVTGTVSLAALEGTEWVLRKLDGAEETPAVGEATLVIEADKVSGSTGCNRYNGTIAQGPSETSLEVGPLATTRMACPEPLMAQEQAFLVRLAQAEVFQFLVGDLVLTGADGALVFSPRKE